MELSIRVAVRLTATVGCAMPFGRLRLAPGVIRGVLTMVHSDRPWSAQDQSDCLTFKLAVTDVDQAPYLIERQMSASLLRGLIKRFGRVPEDAAPHASQRWISWILPERAALPAIGRSTNGGKHVPILFLPGLLRSALSAVPAHEIYGSMDHAMLLVQGPASFPDGSIGDAIALATPAHTYRLLFWPSLLTWPAAVDSALPLSATAVDALVAPASVNVTSVRS